MAASEGIDDGGGDEGRIRASAADIYDRVKGEAAEELDRPAAALAFSGFFAGASVGFGAVASAAATVALAGHSGARLVGAIFFPIGFIIVIIGRAQLYRKHAVSGDAGTRRAPLSARDTPPLGRCSERESDRRFVLRCARDPDGGIGP